jgi:hypothetical protein
MIRGRIQVVTRQAASLASPCPSACSCDPDTWPLCRKDPNSYLQTGGVWGDYLTASAYAGGSSVWFLAPQWIALTLVPLGIV